jgi:hypothetical protein
VSERKPWEVWDEWSDRHGTFETLAKAEKSARRLVSRRGETVRICLGDRLAASVRQDALGRVWVDVEDSTLA